MKRIFSLMLCITLIAGTFSFTFAADYNTPSDFEEMKGLLSAVGITDENFDASERNITRGEYTALVVKASGLSEYLGDAVIKDGFSDVTAENPYAAYIAMAKQRGIAFGYSDGTFRADETVSFAEAVVYLTRLMGYTDIAEARGGFPTGYLVTAESIGITKGVNMPMDAALTSAAAVHLIFNALESEVMAVESWTPGNASFTVSKGPRLMYQSFGIETVKGVMDEVDLSALIGPNELPPYSVSIDGVIIDIGRLAPNSLLGYYVNAYYKNENGMNVLVYVCADSNKNSVKTVKISDITDISAGNVSYTDNFGKEFNLKYEKGAAILYNGAATKSFFNTSIYLDSSGNKLAGNIELLDNNGDGIADVVCVNAYEEFIAGKKDDNENILYDKNDPSNKITLDTVTNDPYTIIFDETGKEISLAKIKPDMSVIIQRSKPDAYQGYIRVFVSSKTVSGRLEGLNDEDAGKTVLINKKVYPMTAYALKYYNDAFMGKEITARLNKFGEVAFIEASDSDGSVWGLLKGMKVAKTPFENSSFYIYTENGTDEILEPAKLLKIDNREKQYSAESTVDMAVVSSILETASEKTQTRPDGSSRLNTLIKYRLNEEGKIASIDTVLNSDGDTAAREDMVTDDSLIFDVFSNVQCVSSAGYYTLGTKLIVDKANKVFLYPTDNSADGYSVTICSTALKNSINYSGYAFYSGKDSVAADAFVMADNGVTYYPKSSNSYMSMVVKITDTVDSDGLAAKKLYLFHNNQPVTYICNPALVSGDENPTPVGNLKCGDIIYCAVNELTNKLESFQLRYDAENDTIYNGYINGQNIVKAYPYISTDRGMHYVVCNNVADVPENYKNGGYRAGEFISSVAITVFDKSKKGDNRVTAGTVDDILSYSELREECSKLVVHTYSTTYQLARSIFIIK